VAVPPEHSGAVGQQPALLKFICYGIYAKQKRMNETLSTLGLKEVTEIGIWNVRTLYEKGKIQQLESEMIDYKLDIPGVSEVRWNQFGDINIAGGGKFIFSGRGGENDDHKEGVGILITKAVRKSLIEWHPVSERLLIARFRTSIRNISIIQRYAPTGGGAEEQKEKCYSRLNKS
jgi:hypothetical protein